MISVFIVDKYTVNVCSMVWQREHFENKLNSIGLSRGFKDFNAHGGGQEPREAKCIKLNNAQLAMDHSAYTMVIYQVKAVNDGL